MKRIVIGLPLLGLLALAAPLAAQQPQPQRSAQKIEDVVKQSGVVEALESLTAAAQPELERTFEQLAGSLNLLVTRIANDPELRASALRAASGMANVAEAVVVEQSNLLRDALRAAAEALDAVGRKQETRSGS
jgi:hypothetical protein